MRTFTRSYRQGILNLSNLRHLILLLLLFTLAGCRASSSKPVNALLSEADKLGDQQIKVMNQWAREFGQTFSEQNRAQFPANREWLNGRAQKILPLIDESSRLGNESIEKYEEASRLLPNDQHRKGLAIIASSLRKTLEIEQLLKAQAQLSADPTITDAKAFNDKFVYFNGLIQQKQKEKDDQFAEGKRLMLAQ